MSIPPDIFALTDSFNEPAVLLDLKFRIIAANEAYQDHYGRMESLCNRHCYEVSHGNPVRCDLVGEDCPVIRSIHSGTPQRALHIHHTPRGEEHVDVEARPVADHDGKTKYILEVVRESKLASPQPSSQGMVGRSPAFIRMLGLAHRVAGSDVTTLLLGESGSGKEVVAQAIHDQSQRKDGCFIPVECSGLTESLFESELFGHDKGAFTGANHAKEGLVEAARGGTLFLDEVGDIPLRLQVKLLRLLETNSYRRVGSTHSQKADFRLICATHRNLEDMVEQGQFRQDLFYRISAFPITLPPLRERREDIALLAASLLERIPTGKNLTLAPDAVEHLCNYDFPGNVRELRNILERASLMTADQVIHAEHLPPHSGKQSADEPNLNLSDSAEIITLEEMENRYLKRALEIHKGDRRSLARKLGISERTLFRKLQRLN